ncbi:MAG: Crp/Fnr family transcriptional regulator [Candidatus Kapabacteria bacterium]|nr:Crp/Fnr family transcriptional regulator [Candidatus Kapabacteria bacterium]
MSVISIYQPSCDICGMRNETVFSYLTMEQCRSVKDSKRTILFQTSEELFREDTNPRGVYCVLTGKVKLSKYGSEGREQILRFAKAGDILGYSAVLTQQHHRTSAIALEQTHTCFIPAQQFNEIVQKNHHFSMALMKMMSLELMQAENRIIELAQKTLRERLAETLLQLEKLFGTDQSGEALNVSLTRDEIAGIVGTATESVIRQLSQFKSEKLIDLHGKKIAILNKRELTRMANLA